MWPQHIKSKDKTIATIATDKARRIYVIARVNHTNRMVVWQYRVPLAGRRDMTIEGAGRG